MYYKHFSIEEREEIQRGVWNRESIRSIAKRLSRSPSSVAREIQRNLPPLHYQYTPRLAHARAFAHRKSRGKTGRLKNDNIRAYVITHLKERWSPEQIAATAGAACGETISHEAIYQFIYAQVHRNGWGELKPGCQDLRPYLRRRRKRRIKKGARRCQRIFHPKGVSIDERPALVDQRIRYGDWESDTVESIDHKPGINTLVERKSGLVLITPLSDKTSQATFAVITRRFRALRDTVKHTITFDNGPENSQWQEVERITGVTTFFAHAYHSWERGTNENTNGLVRDYFPKKTDFTMIPAAAIAAVEYRLNTRPRKRLGWKTPLEVFNQGVALQS